MGMDDDAVHSGVHLPYNREDLDYELTVRQEPKQARMCGIGTKADRRPIDPPPVVQLRVVDKRRKGAADSENAAPPSSYLQNPYYFMYASLASPETDDELHLLKDGKTRCTTGSVVSSLYCLKDPEATGDRASRDAGFFVFPDLSVRTEGTYRLKLTLFEVVGANVHHCKSIFSARFYVYTAKKFPGMEESTNLSCALADQGIKVRIRKDVRARKITAQNPQYFQPVQDSDDENEDDDDDSPRDNTRDRDRDVTMEDARAPKRPRSDAGEQPPSPRAPPPPPADISGGSVPSSSGTWSAMEPSLGPPPTSAPVHPAEYDSRAYNTPPTSSGVTGASSSSAPSAPVANADDNSAPASATSPHPSHYPEYARGPVPYAQSMYPPPHPNAGYGWGYGYPQHPPPHLPHSPAPSGSNASSSGPVTSGPGQAPSHGGYAPMMHHGPPPPHSYPYYEPINYGHGHHASYHGHAEGPPTPVSPPHGHGHGEYPSARGMAGVPVNAPAASASSAVSPTSPSSATSTQHGGHGAMYPPSPHYAPPPPQGYYGGVGGEPYGAWAGNAHHPGGNGGGQMTYGPGMRPWGGDGYSVGSYGMVPGAGSQGGAGMGGYVRPGPDDGSGRRSPPVPSISGAGRDRIQLAPLRSTSSGAIMPSGQYSAGPGKKNPLSIGSIISPDET